MKKRKEIKFKESVHYSIKNRKAYKRNMILSLLVLIIILLGCAAMFTFGCVTWDPDKGFEPVANPTEWWQILLVVLGAIISVGSLVAWFFFCYHSFKGFYTTQAIYQKTSDFKERKAKALKVALYKLKKKNLKWYKKLGYITADQMRHALEEQQAWIKKCKQEKIKINYANPKA